MLHYPIPITILISIILPTRNIPTYHIIYPALFHITKFNVTMKCTFPIKHSIIFLIIAISLYYCILYILYHLYLLTLIIHYTHHSLNQIQQYQDTKISIRTLYSPSVTLIQPLLTFYITNSQYHIIYPTLRYINKFIISC